MLGEISSTPKTGKEKFENDGKELGYDLYDFWVWNCSDIMVNITRGRLAEFIVGTALEIDFRKIREEWDAYDLMTKEGIKIEVKSASYIQSWKQKRYSSISFSIGEKRGWNEEASQREAPKRYADVYVFCLLHHKEQETVNPLKLEQWSFYVLPTYCVGNCKNSKTIGLRTLRKMTREVCYEELNEKIQQAFKEEESNR